MIAVSSGPSVSLDLILPAFAASVGSRPSDPSDALLGIAGRCPSEDSADLGCAVTGLW
jgi:hypothetical protein